MNIDKFGNHVHKRLRLSEILEFKENTLMRSQTGNYDLQSSRLTGVGEPITSNDVVNKKYVDDKIFDLCTKREMFDLIETIKLEIEHKLWQLEQRFKTKDSLDINKENEQRASSKGNT
jgi:hypothetical protein